MMSYLLDTHTFLWFIADHPSLSRVASALIIDPKNAIFVSIATPWEIAIKSSLGKLALNEPFDPYISREIVRNRFSILPITLPHLARLTGLPLHHRDPFDRLLAAQAIAEGMPILGADAALDAYPIARIW